jgi:hypothetical protein
VIRPSLLNRAERCGLVPALAVAHPECGPAADRGTAIHADIAKCGAAGEYDGGITPEAKAALNWIRSRLVGELVYERCVSLVDTDTMDTVTDGTPDLIAGPDSDGAITVIDWKTGQPDNVPEADDNLQLLAYGLAACEGRPFRVCLAFLDGDAVDARWSRTFGPSEHPALFARVKAAATREPVASPGDHCVSCYQRHYCDAWRARTRTALAMLPESTAITVTDETAAALVQRVKTVREAADMAEALVRAHVKAGGRCVVDGKEYAPTMTKGRESVDAKAVKEAGLVQFIKAGAPYETWRWRKVA